MGPSESVPCAQTLSDGQSGFDRRWQRVLDCVRLGAPDRMPIGMTMNYWLARYGGISHRQQTDDYERETQIAEELVAAFEPDYFPSPFVMTTFGPMLDAIDFRQLEWPGHGVGDHQPYQYLDREYMTADEYDDFLFDPTGFYYEKYLPRVAGAFDGMQPLASLTGSVYLGLGFATMAFADESLQAAFDRVRAAGEAARAAVAADIAFAKRMARLETPTGFGLVASAPYDALADFCRGATGMMKDLYRRPEKVLAALDKMATLVARQTLAKASFVHNPLVFIPVHWAADPYMSQKQFRTFWWPSFARMAGELAAGGLIPMPLWQSDCSSRLETLRELEPGSCVHWFDNTDLVRAFEVLDDVAALRGGLTSSMMTTGTPHEIDAAVRELAERVFHRGGRLIFDSGFGIPDETPAENVRAMFAAARAYGG